MVEHLGQMIYQGLIIILESKIFKGLGPICVERL